MAHGKGTITKILASSPSSHPGAGDTQPNQEEHGCLVQEATQQASLKDDREDQLTPPVSEKHDYMSCDPNPVDMEDTCSEYDNVGSDVEQDYDEVLHLNRDGVVDMRYYKHYCPEDEKHTVGDNNNENIAVAAAAADQITQKPCRSTEKSEESQPHTKPYKTGHHLRPHCAMIVREEVEESILKSQRDRFFFSDGDELEEVLDGARFIEDLQDTKNHIQRPAILYQDNGNDRIRKGGTERKREDGPRVPRNHNNPEASRKCEPSHMNSKERGRHCKGQGKRGTGKDTEQIPPGMKGCVANSTEQRLKASSKDCRKSAVKSKARVGSGRQNPPPGHAHVQVTPDIQEAQAVRETPPGPRPGPSAACRPEAEPMVSKQSPTPHHTPEQQQGILEKRQKDSEKPEQVQLQGEKPSPAVLPEEVPEPPRRAQGPELASAEEDTTPKETQESASFPSFEDVPGPCEPEDLIDGIIFAANYLGCTQVLSDKNPSKSVRMSQAHEAIGQIKSQDEDSQMMTEVDLFISTKAVKVLNADTQETMMDSALRTISYIADIGSIVVLMARRRMSEASSEDFSEASDTASEGASQYRMICYVFESEDAQLIAQSIGQAFSVAYREFLRANGINPTDLSHKQYSDIINSQEMYHDDLVHFSNSDNCKELNVEKQKGESLGVVIVESGWGSILPTVILAGMLNSGPAARSGKLSVGDQIMSINDTSLVGLPLAACQSIIKGLKNQVKVKLSIVSCPPVTTVLIKRPDLKFQLGFSVQNGIICSLMRGGIAERGGVRVGHRIIEINGQSVVAMAHEKIVQTLSLSVGEINMKTMPAVMFRLLTGQETPVYI
ncbi:amyloid-beta A4 precursor protein-binding family A member 2 isoform X2 [Cololabis saira]|uniref:amyloid-beta A4 precursor protein-binding family A member 2 isoform X2 n=1 Tax=Cololabis saira TaxID=129043 RepID=UPI002AD26133|nr:amyloid-beta A4 precursor protein-binding family A member 2 isoform X2 [Cololabis saira]